MSGTIVFGCDISADGAGIVVVMRQIDGVMHVLSSHRHESPTYEETLKWATDLMNNYEPLGPVPGPRSKP